MLMAGKNITQKGDTLSKISVEYLYHSVVRPKPEMEARIRQLRNVKQIDGNRYSLLKKELPYIVCGIFSPPVRKIEHFSRIEYFIIDIDHIGEKGLDVEALKRKLQNDENVMLMFLSPGEDGLKLLFALSEPCYDAAKYSLFYKVFSKKFSIKYGLDQVVDYRTSDVSRACFISFDYNAYYNAQAEKVVMTRFLDFDNPFEVMEIKREMAQTEKEIGQLEPQQEKSAIPNDVLQAIKEKLGTKVRLKPEKNIFVPQELDDILSRVIDELAMHGIEVMLVENIHYGKKICSTFQGKHSEVNLFYGKRGFTVVETTKSGTDKELNTVTASVIASVVNG